MGKRVWGGSQLKSSRFQSDDERVVLTAMIVNTRVLSKIHVHLKGDKKPFRSRWANLVGRWCLDYYAKYQRAPQGAIQHILQRYAEETQDDSLAGLAEKFLASLDADYRKMSKELNEDFVVDLAARFFNAVRLEKLNASIEDLLLRKQVEDAHKAVSAYLPISLATTSFVNVLTDMGTIKDALDTVENDVLIQYPSALGEFFGPDLQRDGFVAFLAPEKRGKSFWLLDVAWRSVVAHRRRTMWYSVGDMSQRQMLRRVITRAVRRPLRAGQVIWPKAIRKMPDGSWIRKTQSETFQDNLLFSEAVRAFEDALLKSGSTQSKLRMKCTSNSTTSIEDIRIDIEDAIRDGWIPDVLVLDYMDILAPEPGTKSMDFRQQINESWKAVRRLTQDYHILVVTATQSDADSYDRVIMRRRNFSEDKRKFGHVTGIVGLNQTEEEKTKGIFRLNWIVRREGDFSESNCVAVAGAVALGNPAMTSVWDNQTTT